MEIPGFVLESREKQPMTIWEDPYHFHSYWTPTNTSKFHGSVRSLSVDTFVFDNREDALAWVRAYEADSAVSLAVRGVDTTYRFRAGVAEIAFMTDDIIAVSSALAERGPAGSVPEEGPAREAAVLGAEMLIRNLG